jgi:hypothetical protein
VDGWIVGFRPDLKYADGGGTPRVDVIHLHHGVWISNGAPEFAAGEEKTHVTAPPGYGWRYRTSDSWVMNYMIHNRSTGIAYPIANGPVAFDSGDLGTGPPGRTAAAQRLSWKLPRRLPAGTYTYFCRIHPFMRGAFRIQRSRR